MNMQIGPQAVLYIFLHGFFVYCSEERLFFRAL